MEINLTAYLCPACQTRFALESDACLPDPVYLYCPACGRYEMEFNRLAKEELEAWSLWHKLDLHLSCLPAELRLPLADWSLADEPTPNQRGLNKCICPDCRTRTWLPSGAGCCPACGEGRRELIERVA